MSGGRSLPSQIGDISAIDPDGAPLLQRFVIECKHYNTSFVSDALYSLAGGTLGRWWRKLGPIATKNSRLPLLICRENAKPILFSMSIQQMSRWRFGGLHRVAVFPHLGIFLIRAEAVLDDEEFHRWVFTSDD